MVLINLKQSTHFDLIEILTEQKREFFSFIEKYDIEYNNNDKDNFIKEYLEREETKNIYARCVDKCKKIDTIIAELKDDNIFNKHLHLNKNVTIKPNQNDNNSTLVCNICGYEEIIKGDPRKEE